MTDASDSSRQPASDTGFGATPTAEPGAAPAAHGPNRFFDWVASLGLVRQNSWLGGVCGAIAARIGIDPLIVRGLFVVAGLIGLPAMLLYAACWALLPDAKGEIHLRNSMQGRFDPPMIASIVMAAVSLLPAVGWFGGLVFWPYGWDRPSGFRAVLATLLFIGLAVLTVVAIVQTRRRQRYDAGAFRNASGAVPMPGSGGAHGEPAEPGASQFSAASEFSGAAPAQEPYAASAPGVGDWREQQAQWRTQHQQWRHEQRGADAEARRIAQQERAAQAAEFARAAEHARAARRAANPRTPWWFVLAAVGAAVLTGAIIALASMSAGMLPALTAGLWGMVIAGGGSMLVAGILRFRSGFLAFLTVLALVGAVPVTAASTISAQTIALAEVNAGVDFSHDMQVVGPDNGYFVEEFAPERFSQLYGSTVIGTYNGEQRLKHDVVMTKSFGFTQIYVANDTAIDLTATVGPNSAVRVYRYTSEDLPGGGRQLDLHRIPLREVRTLTGGGSYWRASVAGESDDPDSRPQARRIDIAQLNDIEIYIEPKGGM